MNKQAIEAEAIELRRRPPEEVGPHIALAAMKAERERIVAWLRNANEGPARRFGWALCHKFADMIETGNAQAGMED